MDSLPEPLIRIEPGDVPRIAGTRLTIYDIMDYLDLGWDHGSIAGWLRISSEQVKAAIHQDHSPEAEAVYKQILARHARSNPPETAAKLAASEAKWGPIFAEYAKRREQERHASNPG